MVSSPLNIRKWAIILATIVVGGHYLIADASVHFLKRIWYDLDMVLKDGLCLTKYYMCKNNENGII